MEPLPRTRAALAARRRHRRPKARSAERAWTALIRCRETNSEPAASRHAAWCMLTQKLKTRCPTEKKDKTGRTTVLPDPMRSYLFLRLTINNEALGLGKWATRGRRLKMEKDQIVLYRARLVRPKMESLQTLSSARGVEAPAESASSQRFASERGKASGEARSPLPLRDQKRQLTRPRSTPPPPRTRTPRRTRTLP